MENFAELTQEKLNTAGGVNELNRMLRSLFQATGTMLKDADSDTKVEVEKNADEDKIRLTAGGTERVVIDSTGVDVKTNKILNVVDPVSDQHAATKKYVDDRLFAGARIKGWINFNGTGVIAIADSYNVTSITDNGVGDYTITWDTNFANTDYCVVGLAGRESGTPNTNERFLRMMTRATGSCDVSPCDSGNNAQDAEYVAIMAIGDQ